MLTRLSDRIETEPDGGEVIIKRYGMWGTMSEIEKRGQNWFVVHPNMMEEKFKRRADAEEYLKGVVNRGHK